MQLVQNNLGDLLDGEAIISRLNAYLFQVESLLEAVEPGDNRGILLTFEQARKSARPW